MRLLIGADIVLRGTDKIYFENGKTDRILDSSLRHLLASVDFRVFNMEVPLTDMDSPIQKCGPNLRASTETVKGLQQLGADLLTLANNHIMDQGPQGLESTMAVLNQAGIAFAGAGENLQAAAKPFILERDGMRIGFYCCTEHEFSIAGDSSWGANPFDSLESLDHIADLKALCNYVVCLYHGGKELYPYPTPGLQKVCRKIVEKGADLVVCQHSHCVGCEEKYGSGTIVYGQGNFIFESQKYDCYQTALLIELQIGADVKIIYHPLCRKENKLCLAGETQILQGFGERSREILRDGFIPDRFQKLCKGIGDWDLLQFTGAPVSGMWFRGLNKLSGGRYARWYCRQKLKKQTRLNLRNRIECETWREIVLELLRA